MQRWIAYLGVSLKDKKINEVTRNTLYSSGSYYKDNTREDWDGMAMWWGERIKAAWKELWRQRPPDAVVWLGRRRNGEIQNMIWRLSDGRKKIVVTETRSGEEGSAWPRPLASMEEGFDHLRLKDIIRFNCPGYGPQHSRMSTTNDTPYTRDLIGSSIKEIRNP